MSASASLHFTLYGKTPKVAARFFNGALFVEVVDGTSSLCVSGPPEKVKALMHALADAAESIPAAQPPPEEK
jgi:hypothetical protein